MLLGATFWTPIAWAEGTVYQGGAATNTTSEGVQKAQANVAKILGIFGMVSGATVAIAKMIVGLWGLNLDALGITMDALLLSDAKSKKGEWNKDLEPLQATARNIGGLEDLEAGCEGEDGVAIESSICNALNANLDKTEVHVQTLVNTGLEALEDVSGSVLTTPEELLSARPYIEYGFGTTDTPGETTDGTDGTETATVSDEQKKQQETRRKAHLQKVGTAGVARADLGSTVAVSEREISGKLSEFVGSGATLMVNTKILAGLDLTLAQRLNLLNMMQGEQVANEAAAALQVIE